MSRSGRALHTARAATTLGHGVELGYKVFASKQIKLFVVGR
jgi:hypothetical protein